MLDMDKVVRGSAVYTLIFSNNIPERDMILHIVKSYPNTYLLSKLMGENTLIQEGKNLPVAIVRPTIVGPACKEPLPVSH